MSEDLNIPSQRIIKKALWSAAVLSLIILFGLRFYAIYYGSYIKTPWDNKQYREYAVKESNKTPTVFKAVNNILLPTSRTAIRRVSIGYHFWLVLGQRLNRSFKFSTIEETFQWVNAGLLLLSAACIFLFSRWATNNTLYSLITTFLFVSSPAVFGLNRWVLTENHVFTSLVVFSYFASRLLAGNKVEKSFWFRQEILQPAVTAYIMAIFSTVREYAVPSFVAISLCVFIGLILENRSLAAVVFAVILSPFCYKLAVALKHAFLKSVLVKLSLVYYFHPLKEYVPHIILYFVGPAMSLFLGVLAVLMIRFSLNFNLSKKNIGLQVLLLGHVFLILFYSFGIVLSNNRDIRGVISPMVLLLCSVLIAVYLIPQLREAILSAYGRILALLLIFLSWSVLIYQLFFAFNGGETYELHPFNMEYFNFPMHLRQLKGPDDYHVSGGEHWQAYVKQYIKEHRLQK